MEKLIVELKQHTPLIHFQPNQTGATLRASDVKPRLDKYLIKNCRYAHPIKYKMNVVINRNSSYQNQIYNKTKDAAQRESSGLYYGNQGNTKPKQLILDHSIKIIIDTYFNKQLKQDLKTQIPIMFALENFGSRNNKGLGCFFPVTIEGKNYRIKEFEDILRNNHPAVYYWDCSSITDAFFEIKFFYSLLKSNINLSTKYQINGTKKEYGTYYKSMLYLYFIGKGITWEKRKIKNDFMLNTGKEDKIGEANNYKFVRALLGSSEIQEWKYYADEKVEIDFPDDIKRIPSSVVFKIYSDNSKKARIYFWIDSDLFDKTREKILDKEFKFTSLATSQIFHLKTPDNFDTVDFLSTSISKIKSTLIKNADGDQADSTIEEIDTYLKTTNDIAIKKSLEKKKGIIRLIKNVDKTILKFKNGAIETL